MFHIRYNAEITSKLEETLRGGKKPQKDVLLVNWIFSGYVILWYKAVSLQSLLGKIEIPAANLTMCEWVGGNHSMMANTQ